MRILYEKFSKINYEKYIRSYYGITVLILCISCIVIRAHYSAITLDEAHTYLDYVKEIRPGYMKEFLANYDGRANNHLLNTGLMWVVDRIIGLPYDEFLVRLPNVFFGVVYSLFCYILYRKKEISSLEFSLFLLNGAINGVFAIGRGYGIALCLTLIASYYMKRFAESDYTEERFLTRAIAFLTIATSANTVVLLITAAAGTVIFICMITKKVLWSYLKNNWTFLAGASFLNILLLIYHIYISAEGEGKALATFHGNPVDGIIKSFLDGYLGRFSGIGAWLFLLLLIVVSGIGILKKKELLFSYIFTIYFVICIVTSVVLKKGMPSNLALMPTFPIMIYALSEIIDTIRNVVDDKLEFDVKNILWTLFTVGSIVILSGRFTKEINLTINNDLRTDLYDTIMGACDVPLDSEEFHDLHTSFYHKQFLYRYGYDIYSKEYTIANMSIAETLEMLQQEKFDAIIDIRDRETLKKYAYEFGKLGININKVPEVTDFILLNRGEEEDLEYIYAFKGENGKRDTILGEMAIYYGENGSYGIYVNGNECIVVDPEETESKMAICVWHDGNQEPFSYKIFKEK